MMSTFIEQQHAGKNQTKDSTLFIDQDEIKPRKTSLCKTFGNFRIYLLFVTIVVAVPLLTVYRFEHDKEEFPHVCSFERGYRIRCGLASNVTDNYCVQLKCCFDEETLECFHYIPSLYNYDSQGGVYQNSTPFGRKSYSRLKLSVEERDPYSARITLHGPDETHSNSKIKDKTYLVAVNKDYLGVEVFRSQTGERLLTTLRGPLIASDNYWEWSFQISTNHLFGLGETVIPFNKTVQKIIYKNRADHNTLPSFLAYANGSFHGVTVDHDGPLEVTVLPSRLVVLKSLAGNRITLDLHVGPRIRDIVTNGFKAPAYWVLGVHVCRYGNFILFPIQ